MFFFFNDTATTEIYTLSLHDALPIFSCPEERRREALRGPPVFAADTGMVGGADIGDGPVVAALEPLQEGSARSEEHTSELQSRQYLVCRLLLEKKKTKHTNTHANTTC